MEARVRMLVKGHTRLVADLVNEAERLYEAGDEEQAGRALYRAERGFPKNKKFRKLMQEAHYQRLVQKTEAIYLADNAKNLPIVDEHLYYAVDLKQKTIEMTEKGKIGRAHV